MKIQIVYPGMYSSRKHYTGDYWVYQYIMKALYQAEHVVTEEKPDIQWQFIGLKERLRYRWTAPFRVAWIYARPHYYLRGRMLRKIVNRNHLIYTISQRHADILKKHGVKCKPLLPAAGQHYQPRRDAHKYQVVYLGTGGSRSYRTSTINRLAVRYSVAVCGIGWNNTQSTWLGDFWPNENLGEFYNQAPLSIYMMPKSYQQVGLIPVRVLDAMASSDNLCIVQENCGLKEIFGDIVPPTFRDVSDLLKVVKYYLQHDQERQQLQQDIREHLSHYTYEDLCKQVISDARQRGI